MAQAFADFTAVLLEISRHCKFDVAPTLDQRLAGVVKRSKLRAKIAPYRIEDFLHDKLVSKIQQMQKMHQNHRNDPKIEIPAGPSLLGHPAEVRNKIYGYVFHDRGYLHVNNGSRIREPALLSVNRQLRRETAPIFYFGHRFFLYVHDLKFWEVEPLLIPLRKFGSDSPPSFAHVTFVFRKDKIWKTLLRWVRGYHANVEDQIMVKSLEWIRVTDRRATPASAWVNALQGAFDIATELKDKPWSETKAVLEIYHRGLAAVDKDWK